MSLTPEAVDWQHNDPEKRVHHVLTFCDDRENGDPIIAFESFSPFSQIAVGDYINTTGWNIGFEGHGLKAVRISHRLSLLPTEILHQTFVYCRWASESAHGEGSLS